VFRRNLQALVVYFVRSGVFSSYMVFFLFSVEFDFGYRSLDFVRVVRLPRDHAWRPGDHDSRAVVDQLVSLTSGFWR